MSRLSPSKSLAGPLSAAVSAFFWNAILVVVVAAFVDWIIGTILQKRDTAFLYGQFLPWLAAVSVSRGAVVWLEKYFEALHSRSAIAWARAAAVVGALSWIWLPLTAAAFSHGFFSLAARAMHRRCRRSLGCSPPLRSAWCCS